MKIAVITPVRNEETHIRTTLECMVRQTCKPVQWVIVDDGSTDETGRIVRSFAEKNDFIKYVYRPDRGFRRPGAGVVQSFYDGLRHLDRDDYDVISKFDGDLSFESDLQERIIAEFRQNPELGITGPTRLERKKSDGPFKPLILPEGFVGGPTKFYRRRCFEDIGGLIQRSGWDGVDNIRANMMKWETYEIKGLEVLHLKATGTAKGEGIKKANMKYGDVSYYMGGYLWYFLLRVLMRSIEERNPMVGYYMLAGYIKSKLSRLEREPVEFKKFLRKKQINNVKFYLKMILFQKN